MTRTPPNPFAAVAVLVQLHDRDFSSSVAQERLSNSFTFYSFAREQALWDKAKKTQPTVNFSQGVRSQPLNYAVYATALICLVV